MKNLDTPIKINTRYNFNQGLDILRKMPMGELMYKAHKARLERFPGNYVSFVYDTNPNYTNICITGCKFCAFSRKPRQSKGYTLTPSQLAAKVKRAYELGAATALIQGGHNPDIDLNLWLSYIREVKAACPNIHIHPFSPSEYVFMAEREKKDVQEILEAVFAEGVDTIPGGGAEILSDRVRGILSKDKASVQSWLDVCEKAHKIGFKTTATMMYGHIETDEEIVEHLIKLRELQDKTGGFSSFIPWSFKPGGSCLGKGIKNKTAHPAKYIRIIALARLMLDNFSHIQSSWFSENEIAGQLGLLAGADDFGGVLEEENVLAETGHKPKAAVESVKKMIRQAGFKPVRRDSHYNLAL